MTFAIGVECLDVKDLGCVQVCPVDCIYEGARRLYIHPFECIDCGVCVDVCPVDAISSQGYADTGLSPVVAANAAFFSELLPGRPAPLGSPGAAADVGPVDADTSAVRSLPPAGWRLMPADLPTLLRRFWHPVATAGELAATEGGLGPIGVRLLGENLVVADLGDGPVALRDRCLHRSTRLSAGWLAAAPDGTAATIQCAYHGWQWDGSGRCVGVPCAPAARPGAGLPARKIASYDTELRYGLIWVRLETGWGTSIPECPAYDDPAMRAVAGEPYTWPTSLERRVENFTDLAHFAWVHDGSLGDRSVPEVPIPQIRQEAAALRFHYDPPALPPEADEVALVGSSAYVVTMPGTVDIGFDIPVSAGGRCG